MSWGPTAPPGRFHNCDHDAHRELVAAYLTNERIDLNFDDVAPGLSRYVHDAITANANRQSTRRPFGVGLGVEQMLCGV
ncbi:TipAS antibiotic-recognition domain-containing protein [Actinophytocola gossypii]|uniref:TipAS antibiotic-recognition domain-containing protein n=1 Tax=Actinophytocola gossypii TaxID=2812003 RepID=UPI0035CD3209